MSQIEIIGLIALVLLIAAAALLAAQKQRSRESVQLEPKPLPKKEERGANSP